MPLKIDLLQQLDQCASIFTFPMLDNGYVYFGNAGLHVMQNYEKYAVVIDVWGFNPRSGQDGLSTILHVFGNCIKGKPGFTDNVLDVVYPIRTEEVQILNDDESYNCSVRQLMIRDSIIDIPTEKSIYSENQIQIEEEIMVYDVMRYLGIKHRSLVMADRNEILRRINFVPTTFRSFDKWLHPDVCNDELPSSSSTFQSIYEAIQRNSVDDLVLPGDNIHFAHWPESGSL